MRYSRPMRALVGGFRPLGRLAALLAMAVGIAAAGCEAQASMEGEVAAALDGYVRAIGEGSPDEVAALYVNSPTTASLGDGRIYRGWATVADLLRGIYGQSGVVHLEAEDVVISPLGRDVAVVYFVAHWSVGREVRTTSRGAMSMVFVRASDGWRVAHEHTSTLPGTTETREARRPALLQSGPPGPVRPTQRCRVDRVVDGDTLECDPVGRIRLIGMDTPERGQDPFGAMATSALEALLDGDATVEVEPDVEDRDRYGRALRYVWKDGVMLNWALVRQGYAVLLTYPPNVQYVDWFRDAQASARDAAAGLWAIDGFSCPPRAFRRGECR